jgi:uncharacterized protein YgiM (DUF1202 family)
VNLRSEPSITSAILIKLPENEEVTFVKKIDNEWTEVIYQGQKGYIASIYLTKDKPYQAEESAAPENTDTSDTSEETEEDEDNEPKPTKKPKKVQESGKKAKPKKSPKPSKPIDPTKEPEPSPKPEVSEEPVTQPTPQISEQPQDENQ